MACKGCAERRAQFKAMKDQALAHAARLLRIRKGGTDGKASRAAPADRVDVAPAAERTGAEPAGKADAAHGKRSVAKASRGRARS